LTFPRTDAMVPRMDAIRLSKGMRQVEATYDKPIENILRTLYYDERRTYEEMEAELGVPRKTIHGWMVRLGINPRRLADQKAAELAS
jgi:hypothetical protein